MIKLYNNYRKKIKFKLFVKNEAKNEYKCFSNIDYCLKNNFGVFGFNHLYFLF